MYRQPVLIHTRLTLIRYRITVRHPYPVLDSRSTRSRPAVFVRLLRIASWLTSQTDRELIPWLCSRLCVACSPTVSAVFIFKLYYSAINQGLSWIYQSLAGHPLHQVIPCNLYIKPTTISKENQNRNDQQASLTKIFTDRRMIHIRLFLIIKWCLLSCD